MEGAVTVLALALLLVALARALESGTDWDLALAGLAAGLVIMARVDFGSVIVLVPIALAVHTRRLRSAVIAGGATLIAVVPWVAWSQREFGHILPVSGYIKLRELSTDTRTRFGGRFTLAYLQFVIHLAGNYLHSLGATSGLSSVPLSGLVLVVVALAGVGASLFALRGRTSGLPASAAALTTVAVIVFAKGVVDLVTLPYWAEAWYSAPVRVLFGIGLGLGVWLVVARVRRSPLVAAFLVGVMLTIGAVPTTETDATGSATAAITTGGWQDASLLAAQWIRRHPHNGNFGSTDSGLLGYELDPTPVVNLDGLANSYDYASLLFSKTSMVDRYRLEHVRYLVERASLGTGPVPRCATTLWLSPWPIPYGGGPDTAQQTSVPLGVFDLASCPG
jgi:hypothetical protein